PFGKTLIKDLNLTLPQGHSLLIQGQSGVGKTTLLRTVAGLWLYAQGEVFCPQHNTLFLSQRPYLPQGDLLTALYYPNSTEKADLAEVSKVLQQVQLAHLQDRLAQEQDWSRILSLGEQQRLAFARLLLHKPQVALLDEATASLDEGLENAMYRLIRHTLPNTTIISVGHRSTLVPLHQQRLELQADGSWILTTG
ncbi:ATP-binding cassette domain-containing protein, partial [Aggregatibacter actinomycetemcomitans]